MSNSNNDVLSSKYLLFQDPISDLFSVIVNNFSMKEYLSDDTPDDKVTFWDNYIPSLKEGQYQLDFDQTTAIKSGKATSVYSNSKKIYVSGPQFKINPKDIKAVYPPAHSSGDHAYVLPHISFSRSTIPWEVSRASLPWIDGDTPDDKDQWLALLVFSDTEIPTIEAKSLGDLGLSDEFNAESDMVNTITITKEVLEKTFPQDTNVQTDLPYLAHVRNRPVGGEDNIVSYVVANRLPQTNTTSVVHLVSLANPMEILNPAGVVASYQFISLYNWTFSCVEDKPTFSQIVMDIDSRAYRLYKEAAEPLPVNQVDYSIENEFYLRGYVPVPHYLRKGEATLSWYRGPLVPDPSCIINPGLGLAHSADNYLQFDGGGSNMLLVAYSAAWQIGRMLTLKNKDVALAIQDFKREVAQFVKTESINPPSDLYPDDYWKFVQQYTFTENQQNIIACIKGIQDDPDGPIPEICTKIVINPIVAKWIGQLMLLEPVPFTYLVPNEAMLPKESIRFFTLDPYWITCMLEGALSIGDERTSLGIPQYLRSDKTEWNQDTNIDKYFTGFLLRSEVVGDYPDMQVEAYTETPTEAKLNEDTDEYDDAAVTLQPIVKRQLSSEVLLCIFDEQIETLDLHMKKEALHLGFTYDEETGALEKYLRNSDGQEQKENFLTVEVSSDSTAPISESSRTLNVTNMINAMKSFAAENKIYNNEDNNAFVIEGSHDFTPQMMEGVPKVRFIVS